MDRDEDDGRERIKENSWEGKKGKEYFERTKNNPPNEILEKYIEKINPGKAIELGPGAGVNTLLLLEKGWNVSSIDISADSEKYIKKLIENDKQKIGRFSFKKCDFNDLKLEPNSCDLIIGFNSIYFCEERHFEEFFKMITNAIKPNGYFIGHLLGERHFWKERKFIEKMRFFSKDEIKRLFTDAGFEIQNEDDPNYEKEEDRIHSGEIKRWHSFLIVARKK